MSRLQATLRLALRKGEEKDFRRGFPWVFSTQLAASALVTASPGELALLTDARGEALGLGFVSPQSLIAWRQLVRGPSEILPEDFFHSRLEAALARRQTRFDVPYFRWVHGDADGLPGLILDRFDRVLVAQVGTAGMERHWPALQGALLALLPGASILLRNDIPARAREGLPQEVRLAHGDVPRAPVVVEEYGVRFLADLWEGQKTGWFYDQRDNRAQAATLAQELKRTHPIVRVADIFSHAGGFGIPAALAGAEPVVLVDASVRALDLARAAATKNGVDTKLVFVQEDAFEAMERLAAEGQRFEIVIADPPPFIPSREHLPQGLRAYTRVARLAANLVAPGGTLAVASCSHHCTAALLRKSVLEGIARAGRKGNITRMTGAAPDHPAHPHLPQSTYLHCAWALLD